MADDPPERVQAWVATVSESALAQLDLEMLLDLLRIEGAARRCGSRSRRSQHRRSNAARSLATSPALTRCSKRWSARRTPMVAPHCEQPRRRPSIDWGQAQSPVTSGCTSARSSIPTWIGSTSCVSCSGRASCGRSPTPSPEKRTPLPFDGSRRCFSVSAPPGADRSSNSRTRRAPPSGARRSTLLRRAGGQEALLELASMLGDDDPEVQRESIHAIVEIGTANAYSVLHRLLLEADTPRESALRELLGLRDDKAVPLFSYVLTKGEPKGKLIGIHISMIEALGVMRPRPESIRALQQVLLRGRWWAPFRTSTQRQAAATSLRTLGTPEALAGTRSRCQRRRPSRAKDRASAGRAVSETGEEHDMSVPQRSRLADELSRRLAAAIRGAQLYAPGHPLVTRSARALIETLTLVHQSTPSVAIGIVGEDLVVGDSAVPRAAETMGELMRRLQQARHRAHRHRPRRARQTRSQQLVAVVARGDGGRFDRGARQAAAHPRRPAAGGRADLDARVGDMATFRRLYDDAVKVAERLWDSASTEGKPDADAARDMVDSLAQAVAQNRTALLALTALKNYDNYTFTHMVNVSILTMGQARGARHRRRAAARVRPGRADARHRQGARRRPRS